MGSQIDSAKDAFSAWMATAGFLGTSVRVVLILLVVAFVLFLVRRLFIARIWPGEKGIRLKLNRPTGVVGPGVYFKWPFFVQYEVVSTRIDEEKADEVTNTSDGVQARFHVTVYYRVGESDEDVKRSKFGSEDPEAQIRGYVQNYLRAAVASIDAKACFSQRQHIADEIKEHIAKDLETIGFVVVNVVIASVELDSAVQIAMNSVVAAEQQRIAMTTLAEAKKAAAVIAAQAEAEVLELEGKGQGKKREAVADGLVEALKALMAEGVGLTVELAAGLLIRWSQIEAMQMAAGNPNARPILMQGGSGEPSADALALTAAVLGSDHGQAARSGMHLPQGAETLLQGGQALEHHLITVAREAGYEMHEIEAHLAKTKEGKAALAMLHRAMGRTGLVPTVDKGKA